MSVTSVTPVRPERMIAVLLLNAMQPTPQAGARNRCRVAMGITADALADCVQGHQPHQPNNESIGFRNECCDLLASLMADTFRALSLGQSDLERLFETVGKHLISNTRIAL